VSQYPLEHFNRAAVPQELGREGVPEAVRVHVVHPGIVTDVL